MQRKWPPIVATGRGVGCGLLKSSRPPTLHSSRSVRVAVVVVSESTEGVQKRAEASGRRSRPRRGGGLLATAPMCARVACHGARRARNMHVHTDSGAVSVPEQQRSADNSSLVHLITATSARDDDVDGSEEEKHTRRRRQRCRWVWLVTVSLAHASRSSGSSDSRAAIA